MDREHAGIVLRTYQLQLSGDLSAVGCHACRRFEQFRPRQSLGVLPSVSAGWVLTNERFMERARGVMDFFKIRASWGRTVTVTSERSSIRLRSGSMLLTPSGWTRTNTSQEPISSNWPTPTSNGKPPNRSISASTPVSCGRVWASRSTGTTKRRSTCWYRLPVLTSGVQILR